MTDDKTPPCVVKVHSRKYTDEKTREEKTTAEVKMFGVLPAGAKTTAGSVSVGGAPAVKAVNLADLC